MSGNDEQDGTDTAKQSKGGVGATEFSDFQVGLISNAEQERERKNQNRLCGVCRGAVVLILVAEHWRAVGEVDVTVDVRRCVWEVDA